MADPRPDFNKRAMTHMCAAQKCVTAEMPARFNCCGALGTRKVLEHVSRHISAPERCAVGTPVKNYKRFSAVDLFFYPFETKPKKASHGKFEKMAAMARSLLGEKTAANC